MRDRPSDTAHYLPAEAELLHIHNGRVYPCAQCAYRLWATSTYCPRCGTHYPTLAPAEPQEGL